MGIFDKIFGKKKKASNKTIVTENIYSNSIDVFFDNYRNPDKIQDKIYNIVSNEEKASLIYLFIPYYFCKSLFPEVQWTDYYLEQDEQGNQLKKIFANSNTLKELDQCVKNNFREYEKRDLKKILFHSGDFKAINEMMHKGSKMEDLEAMPPTIMGSSKNEFNLNKDDNTIVFDILKGKIEKLGYKAEKHPEYFSLVINNELEIATQIIDNPNNHPTILNLMVLTMQKEYFPNGIEENIVGMGTNIQDKANMAIDNFINTTFLPIIDSFTDSHNDELDFTINKNGTDILWHPKLGDLTLQGNWESQPNGEPIFELLHEKLKSKLSNNKLNWLKVYIAKNKDSNEIHSECRLNNEPWEEGVSIVEEYAKTWVMTSGFQGMKQFIMFRKCDASE